jgi:hypothetical protein
MSIYYKALGFYGIRRNNKNLGKIPRIFCFLPKMRYKKNRENLRCKMENNFEHLLKLQGQLKKGQKIEIDSEGKIRIVSFDNEGKKKKEFRGNLFEKQTIDTTVKSKLWANAPEKGIKNWSKFGKDVRRINKDVANDFMVGIFKAFIESFPDEVKRYILTDSNSVKYSVIEIRNYKGYYHNGYLKILENSGKKYYIPIGVTELNMEYLAKCHFCDNIFSQSDISLYKLDYQNNGHVCLDCKKLHPEIIEIIVK